MKVKFFVTFLMAMLFSSIAFASGRQPQNKCVNLNLLLDDIALNGAAGTRTATIYTNGWDVLIIGWQLTHTNDGTIAFTITEQTPKASNASTAQVYGEMQSCSMSSGACTLQDNTTMTTATLTADTDRLFRIDLRGAVSLKIVVTHGGLATADDKFTMTGRVCVD